MDPSTGHISLIATLDYEQTQNYLLIIQVQSVINPSLRSTTNVHVAVSNVNDHTPSFSRSQYSISVLESVGVPSQVVTVTAHDLDLGDFGQIIYSFGSNTEAEVQATFDLHLTNGVISTRATLDRENREMYTFTVEARDGGAPPLVTGVTIVIRVTDVNDERPMFMQSVYTGLILENQAAGSEVTQVQAMDSDSEFSTIEYYIQSGNHGNAFIIATNDGIITNRVHLDREVRSEYTLVVIATDLQFDSLPALVYINVTDENDERPIFSDSFYTPPPVPEGIIVGTILVTVAASDRDEGSNGAIVYTSPDIDPTLSLDPVGGGISVVRPLDYESLTNIYSFTVVATDMGNPPHSASARVEITITDENDNAPIVEGVLPLVRISENLPSHTSVIQLTAQDADSGMNSDLVWAVVGDNGAVGVFGVYDNGLVYTLAPLDRERTGQYQVLIHSFDIRAFSKLTLRAYILSLE